MVFVRRHRQSCHHDAGLDVGPADSGAPVGARLSPTGGRIYASPAHLRAVCPSSNHHVYCDKYEVAAAAGGGGHWFDASTGNQLCWNQTVKFLPPPVLDDELIVASHDPAAYALDRNWTAVAGVDRASSTAVNL